MSDNKWVLSGQLYMVATPIGNLADFTQRAQQVLNEVDLIAAEDTRHSGQLLATLGIQKPLLSLHEHNERSRAQQIITKLASGLSVAYVSDAGVPAISDPGALLVQQVVDAGFTVVPIPGANSVVTAICAAGLDTRDGFTFMGFMPSQSKVQQAFWQACDHATRVSVFFEAPHRIMTTLTTLSNRYPERTLVVAKELTKRFERFVRGSCAQVLQQFQDNPDWQRGEFVLLLAPIAHTTSEADYQNLRVEQVLLPLLAELPLSQAVKLTCAITGLKKKGVYELALAHKQTVE